MTAAPITRPAITSRLQAALGAFLAPERLLPQGNDSRPEVDAGSLTDPLALPPEWHRPSDLAGDLIALSFLPFER